MIRRWWRAFTAWLHDHSDDDCEHCIDMKIAGYELRVTDYKQREEGIERIVRAGFPRQQDGGQ